VLDALAAALHAIQVRQLVPAAVAEAGHVDVEGLASRLRPELVQLWYQMALHGRRDLPLAPAPRSGFEMCLLRMLAFRPAESVAGQVPPASGREGSRDAAAAAKAALAADAPRARAVGKPVATVPVAKTLVEPARSSNAGDVAAAGTPATITSATSTPPQPVAAPLPVSTPPAAMAEIDADRWLELVAASPLRGPARELASHAGFIACEGDVLRLSLSAADDHLKAPALVRMLAEALAPALGAAPQIRFEAAPAVGETLHERSSRDRDARQVAAESAFVNDPDVQRLMSRHGAQVVPDSIRPFDEA